MDLAETLSAMPGATPVPGLDAAWYWSPNRRFHFTAALAADGTRALQVNALDTYDQDLVRAILAAAREQASAETGAGDEQLLTEVDGFAHPGYEFDAVMLIAPAIHQAHARENPDLHARTLVAFPGWHYEFSGDETADELKFRCGHPQGVPISKLTRGPEPFLKMSYANTKTKAGSQGPHRGFTKLPVLLRELELLEGAPGSFVEYENHRGEVWRATPQDSGLVLDGATGQRQLTLAELLDFARDSLTSP
jgi:hypothetical protein